VTPVFPGWGEYGLGNGGISWKEPADRRDKKGKRPPIYSKKEGGASCRNEVRGTLPEGVGGEEDDSGGGLVEAKE